jgi:hypothetical protein
MADAIFFARLRLLLLQQGRLEGGSELAVHGPGVHVIASASAAPAAHVGRQVSSFSLESII